MDTRIGYPNEHLSGNSDFDLSSPSFATAVGLLMKGLERKKTKKVVAENVEEKLVDSKKMATANVKTEKKSIFEKWADKFREFLDNAE